MGVVLMSKRELNRINPSWTSTAAQRLLSGDIYRRPKSVMAHPQQCICNAPKNDRCLTPSI
jgi:hypothetical protein